MEKPVIGCGDEWHIRGLTLYVAVCYDITMIQHWNYHVCHMLLYVAVSPIYITVIQNWNDHWFVAEQ